VPVLPAGSIGQEEGDRPFEVPAGAPLPGGDGLESAGLPAGYHLVAEVLVYPKFKKNLLSQRNMCYHPSHKAIWLQKDLK
jgi:hypothetical protein